MSNGESGDRRDPSPVSDASKDREHREAMQALKREQDEKVRSRKQRKGLILVNTGDGKGKSTAAFGMAFRAAGNGMRVAVVQFIKGTWKTGEKAAFARFDNIDHFVVGEGFTWNTQDRARDAEAAARGFDVVKGLVEASRGESPKYDLLVLDELNVVLHYDYLALEPVLELLRNKPPDLHVVITGRDAKPELIALADTVTEMRPIKHAFDAGIAAQRGVEF